MVDNRLFNVEEVPLFILKTLGLEWFVEGDNDEYMSDEWIRLDKPELEKFRTAANELYKTAIAAAKHIAERKQWQQAGIPPEAVKLVEYSLKNELDMHLIGRYDFAGGLDGVPIKLLEFNADTCSLMPETGKFQKEQWLHNTLKKHGRPYNDLKANLVQQFQYILKQHDDKKPHLLISTMGHPEDDLNTEFIAEIAIEGGFQQVRQVPLDKVIFDPDDGIFVKLGEDDYKHYDFWFKFVPWEFIAYEEPDLMEILTNLVCNKSTVVLNPAFTMLLQSKAIMKTMYDMSRYNDYLLKTTFKATDFYNNKYVAKPIFGRMGENITFHDGEQNVYETEGDYADFPKVYQEIALFNEDTEAHRYQPSIFWAGDACALCFRRQDDPVIDDDAEFVGHAIKEDF